MISVIILTYNRKHDLLRCLEALKGQSFLQRHGEGACEVLIIDNGSTDGTAEAVREIGGLASRQSGLSVRLVENREASSFAAARNLGVRLASSDLIAFLDDDCVPDADWLERIADDLAGLARQHVGGLDAVGGIVLPPPGLRYPAWWHPELNWLVGLSPPGMLQSTESGMSARQAGTYYPQTANMAARRSVLLGEPFQEIEIGFFSGRSVYRSGREDAEFWRRLRLRGYRTAIDHNLRVCHHIPQNRLRLGYITRRAYVDGATYYLREEKDGYLAIAAADVAFAPFRAVKDALCAEHVGIAPAARRNLSLISRAVRQYIWAVRQLGFIGAYVRGSGKIHRVVALGGSVVRAYAGALAGAFKKTSRTLAVAAYRQYRPKRALPPAPRSILVVGCGFLGDMVIMAPSLRLLRERFPAARLALLAHPVGKEFYEHLKIFDEIIVCPTHGVARALSGKHFDVSLIHYFHSADARGLFASPIGYRISYDRDVGYRRQLWYDLADCLVRKDFAKNEVENTRAMLEPLEDHASPIGIGAELAPYQLRAPEDASRRAEHLMNGLGISPDARLIVLNPESAIPYKLWSNEYWMELAKEIEASGTFESIFLCYTTPPAVFEHLARKHGVRARCVTLRGIWDLAAVLARAAVLVTVDSGPKHLAFALGTPTITLYGRSDERRWGAYWNAHKHVALRACPLDLSYEELLNLPPNHHLLRISPRSVFEALRRTCPDRAETR